MIPLSPGILPGAFPIIRTISSGCLATNSPGIRTTRLYSSKNASVPPLQNGYRVENRGAMLSTTFTGTLARPLAIGMFFSPTRISPRSDSLPATLSAPPRGSRVTYVSGEPPISAKPLLIGTDSGESCQFKPALFNFCCARSRLAVFSSALKSGFQRSVPGSLVDLR